MEYKTLFFLVTLFFSLYVQFHPSMGGIWLRHDMENNLRFVPSNLFNLMISPLQKKFFWNYNLLIINYIFLLITSFFILYSIKIYEDRIYT
jgi:hypothetical protein